MLILASLSPTRAEILKSFGISFKQKGCNFDEDGIKTDLAKSFVYLACKGKMDSCKESYGLDIPLLCADTVVSTKGKILRKAKDKKEAKDILLMQSGSEVDILTCMMYESKKFSFIDLSQTRYIFKKFNEEDLENYLKSDEWRGKAGACMVEGFCKKYIKEVVGLESTAKGLQIEKLLPFIRVEVKG